MKRKLYFKVLKGRPVEFLIQNEKNVFLTGRQIVKDSSGLVEV